MTYKPPSSTGQQTKPKLRVEEIQDLFLRKNFQELREYFLGQNQLMDFKHFDLTFSEAQENFKVKHGLPRAPLDIIVTKITGEGTVSFNHGLFDSTSMDLTVSGKCRIRFFAGTYWNSQSTSPDDKDAVTKFSSGTDSSSNVPSGTDSSSNVPSGTIVAFGGSTPPSGWLMCDGTSYSNSEYPDLSKAIGNAFGGTPGATFRVPDLRGRFIRGVDNGAGNDPNATARVAFNGGNSGDVVGSYQSDNAKMPDHRHLMFSYNWGRGGGATGAPVSPTQFVSEKGGLINAENHYLVEGNSIPPKGGLTSFPVDSSGVSFQSGLETRPKNLSANFIIKT